MRPLLGYGVTVVAPTPDGRTAYRKTFISDGPPEALPLILPEVIHTMAESIAKDAPDPSTWHWYGSEVFSARD